MHVELFYEFASTYSYPAVMTVEQRAQTWGVRVIWRPFLLGPIFAAQGWNDSPFNLYPQKGRYMWRDLERLCDELGLPFERPSVFPRRSVLATRVALVGADTSWGPSFTKRVYQLNFVEDRDIDDESTIRALLAELHVDADEILSACGSDAQRARLREQGARAKSLGIFGAPTFVVGEELFWGQDRMEQALAWAARH